MTTDFAKAQARYDAMVPDEPDLPEFHRYTGEVNLLDTLFTFNDGDLTHVFQCDDYNNELHDGSYETWTDPRRNEMHDTAQQVAYDLWLDEMREGNNDY